MWQARGSGRGGVPAHSCQTPSRLPPEQLSAPPWPHLCDPGWPRLLPEHLPSPTLPSPPLPGQMATDVGLTAQLLCAQSSSVASSCSLEKVQSQDDLPVLPILVPAPASLPGPQPSPGLSAMCTPSPCPSPAEHCLDCEYKATPVLSVQSPPPRLASGCTDVGSALCWPRGLGQGSRCLSLSRPVCTVGQ